jgi:chromosome segregation ATPase
LAAAGHGGRRKHRALLLSSLLLLIPVAFGLLFGNPEQVFAERDNASFAWTEPRQAAAPESDQEVRKALATLRAAKEAGEQALRAVEEQFADRSLQDAQEQLAKQRIVVASIGSGDRPQSEEVERERAARLSAERRVREIDEQLQQARSTTAASERSLQEAQGRLAEAIAAREAAWRPAPEGAGPEVREPLGKRAAAKASFSFKARVARYRAARAASRARLRRMREANAPHIKPSLPFF